MWRAPDLGSVVGSLPVDAEVVAGAAGLDRRVTRPRPVSTPEELQEVGEGEIVLTAATVLLALAEPPDELIGRLDAAGVAGVALRVEDGERLPGPLLAAADDRGVPLISVPATGALSDVTAAVLDALLDAQRRRLDHVLDVHQRFAHVVASGGGIGDLATTLHDLVGRTVAVVDVEGRATVTVPADATIDLDPSSSSAARHEIRAGDQRYGEVVVDAGGAGVDADGALAMERAALGIAVRLAQAAAVAAAQERFEALSLEELVAGHGGESHDVVERAATFGWDLHRPRAVLLASVDPPEHGPVPSNALDTIAASARATLGPDAIVWKRSATVAALIAPDTDEPAERRQIAERLREELDGRLRTVNVSIGVGRRAATPTLLPRSFTEASRAVDVGRWAKGRHVTEVFDQLGLERLLASTPVDDLADFVRQAIGPLVVHDRANGTELVDTLAVWFETRNMAEAARRMYVHYNTLKNRLDRIEATIGPVLTDAARALECEVAIYVARHYDVPWDV